jgi:uncharacterized alkaline shock family protein YloU
MNDSYVTIFDENGSINISEDVISVVVSSALKEVDGAAGLAHTVGGELAELLGRKNISKGVRVQFVDNHIVVDVIILVRFGCNIASVAQKVQSSVASSVEAMTGQSSVVNVHVSGVAFDK